MKFYNRESELSLLESTRIKALNESKMTFVVGRRRIGKTSLLLKSVENQKHLYLFVSKKDEVLLCQDFTNDIKNQLGITVYGEIKSFSVLFDFLIEQSKNNPFTLIIDEFQEFYTINSVVFSEMQKIWDLKKKESNLNLILCGSVYTLMIKIFENSKEPLFGRANEKISLKPFSVLTLKHILSDNYPEYTNKDLLSLYAVSGGVAKYVELFMDQKCFTMDAFFNEIFKENSLLLEEGKNVLIEEFGKEYTNYFSVLSLIASSKTARTEMESILEKSVGGYLDKLENQYCLIKSLKPIFAKAGSRKQKYYIEDNFLNFWFRYIYKNKTALEIGNYNYVKDIVKTDFSVFFGLVLEKYFKQKYALEGNFSEIGNFWEKGNTNEIDLIAINKREKTVEFAEIKINKQKINLEVLKEKSKGLIDREFKNYTVKYTALSLEDL
jgi:uncharacterized protein